MTFLICGSTSERITLLSEIADSGEAKVWRTNHHGYLAKIYHEPTPERMEKLAVMIAHPPKEPNSHLNHISFAWPNSSLRNPQGDYVGFLMPEVKGGKELIDVYNPQRRKKLKLEIDWRFLHTSALNIASLIAALHEAGYVLGDINPKNILVNNRALPSIIDTDSFQVKSPQNGKIHRCLVGFPGYTPPELMGKDFAKIEQTEVHDRFRLALIIYQLLFSGNSPFEGKWTGAGETPELDERIKRGIWLYSENSLIERVDRTIPLKIVHPAIRECFIKCFNDGYKNPHLRPTAKEWLEALRIGNDRLTVCDRVDSHFYSRTYGSCYWCDRSAKLGVDIFPGVVKVNSSVVVGSKSQFQVFAATNNNINTVPTVQPTQSKAHQVVLSTPLTISTQNQAAATSTNSLPTFLNFIVVCTIEGLLFVLILVTINYLFFSSNDSKNINSAQPEITKSTNQFTSNSKGVAFTVKSLHYSGGDLVIRVNIQNQGTTSVRFLYSFLDVTDDKGRTLSAITEGLPAELPPNSREFSGAINIPTALLDDVNKISLSLTDYPGQELKLYVADIPIKPFESQKSTRPSWRQRLKPSVP